MARNLAEKLESLSGYRHAFLLGDAKASLNPVNFSHLLITVGGRPYHVLSRVADAGADYSQRTNKLAHHVVLEPRELVPGGPAWVLLDPLFCESNWNGTPQLIAVGRQPRREARPPSVCKLWSSMTADAGWAAVLAETALTDPPTPISVIFPVGTNTLALVDEALGLLEPDQRWQVTFSTYYTTLPAGISCQWRFVLDGSPEAVSIRRNPHAKAIDLCAALGRAPDSPFAEYARTGVAPTRLMTILEHRAGLIPTAEHGPSSDWTAPTAKDRPPMPTAEKPDVAVFEPREAPPQLPSDSPFAVQTRRNQVPAKSLLYVSLAAGIIPFVLAVVLVGWLIVVRPATKVAQAPAPVKAEPAPRPNAADHKPPADKFAKEAPDEPNNSGAPHAEPGEPKAPAQEAPSPWEDRDERSPLRKEGAKESVSGKNPTGRRHDAKKPPGNDGSSRSARPSPLDDVRDKNRRLDLPSAPDFSQSKSTNSDDHGKTLAKVDVDVSECKLTLDDPFGVFPKGKSPWLVETKAADKAKWTVNIPGRDSPKPISIGHFEIGDKRLLFKWGTGAYGDKLRYCVLTISAGDDEERCTLTLPLTVDQLDPDLTDFWRHRFKIPESDVLRDKLRMQVRFSGMDKIDTSPPLELRPNKTVHLMFFEPGALKKLNTALFRMELDFDTREGYALDAKTDLFCRIPRQRPIKGEAAKVRLELTQVANQLGTKFGRELTFFDPVPWPRDHLYQGPNRYFEEVDEPPKDSEIQRESADKPKSRLLNGFDSDLSAQERVLQELKQVIGDRRFQLGNKDGFASERTRKRYEDTLNEMTRIVDDGLSRVRASLKNVNDCLVWTKARDDHVRDIDAKLRIHVRIVLTDDRPKAAGGTGEELVLLETAGWSGKGAR
jgi:hypothetical protein